MGYGLVEVPRVTWNSARSEYQIAHAYFKISKLSVEKEEADEQLTEVLEVITEATLRYGGGILLLHWTRLTWPQPRTSCQQVCLPCNTGMRQPLG